MNSPAPERLSDERLAFLLSVAMSRPFAEESMERVPTLEWRMILTELRELRERVKWKSIEDAPTDASPVILGHNVEQWASQGWYDFEHHGWWVAGSHYTDAHDGQVFPTHYQPLPAPPVES
jgi:hypothetical protein